MSKKFFLSLNSNQAWIGAKLLALLMVLPSCSQDDAQVLQQLSELKARLAKAEEAAQSGSAPTRNGPEGESPALSAAQARIRDLEARLAAAESRAATSSSNPVLNLQELARKMQADLVTKTEELRGLVESTAPSANIQEITVRRIKPPQEIASAFSSAIIFTALDPKQRSLRLEFPVQASLDGAWKLPTVKDIEKSYEEALTAVSNPAPSLGATAPAAPGPQGTGTAPSTFRQVDDKTFQFAWDNPRNGPTGSPAASPAPPQPSAAPINPTAGLRPPQAPAPAQPTVPKPVMPVVQDVPIQFE